MMNRQGRAMYFGVVSCGVMGLCAGAAQAGSHLWDINEVFSNADGTIQFIELWEAGGSPHEVGLPGLVMSTNAHSFIIPGDSLESPTTNKFFLLATEAFAALPNAPTPDAIIPAGLVPFFSTAGDTIRYEPWDTLTFFGLVVVPTNGIHSLNFDLTIGVNSPTNYAGTTGSVDASDGPFCGNGRCDPDEDSCNCPDDCGMPPPRETPGSTCSDGLDNDCDGLIDSIDPDCPDQPIPAVSGWGLIVMALLLLTGLKIRFSGRRLDIPAERHHETA